MLELQKVEILLELQKIDLDELNLVKEKIYQVSESQPGPVPWIGAKKRYHRLELQGLFDQKCLLFFP